MENAEIFQNARLVKVRLQEVDDRDRTFALCWPGERGVEELAAGIGTSGVIAPVWVAGEEKGGDFFLVDGFRRVAAARRAGIEVLPAELLPGDLDPVKLFRARLAGQGARLSAVEASRVLEKLKTQFRVGESTLVETFLPLLGLGRARPLLEQCLGLSALEEPVARYCAENRVGLA
ncbi:MAG: ParB N-terminal domain-containing protein, partial [Candidatus Glassbacteria bacterium]|nr:ParB N-terminal domain-containing protein [Candidatus Glassbacteria bacterium]